MSTQVIPVGSFELELPLPVEVLQPEDAEEEKNLYEVVFELLGQPELFHDHDGSAYAAFEHEGRKRAVQIGSTWFSQIVRSRFMDVTGKMIASRGLADVVAQMIAEATVKGPKVTVHRRVAEHDGAILVDLADGTGRVVRITDLTWDVCVVEGVRFVEDERCDPLPEPVRGGSIDELRPFVNVGTDDAFLLFVGFLLCVFRPEKPHLVLLVNGPQGSSKTTLTRIARRLVDPGKPEIRPLTDKPEDILIGARYARVLAFDNLSGISGKASDTICSLVTGAGYGTRKFYTNLDESFTEVSAFVVLNGIDGLAERGDLADRAIHLELERIPDTKRLDEKSFWLAFKAAQPRILGALFDAVSVALGRLHAVHLPRSPRMADAAKWMTAAEPALGLSDGTFLAALDRNREDALVVTADADPVALAVAELCKFMGGTATKTYTAKTLLDELDARRKNLPPDRYWPKTPARLSSRLTRALPALEQLGIHVERLRASSKKGERLIRITVTTPAVAGVSSVSDGSSVVPFPGTGHPGWSDARAPRASAPSSDVDASLDETFPASDATDATGDDP